MNIHFSSATDLWSTPQDLFDRVDAVYHFDCNVCTVPANAKCARFFSPADDGLKQIWRGTCWMNPPYGREIGRWMSKAYQSFLEGATVVCLIPSRTDTFWWHTYAAKGRVEFLKCRLKFGGCANSAPFPSAIVAFDDSVRIWTRPHSFPEINPSTAK